MCPLLIYKEYLTTEQEEETQYLHAERAVSPTWKKQ